MPERTEIERDYREGVISHDKYRRWLASLDSVPEHGAAVSDDEGYSVWVYLLSVPVGAYLWVQGWFR